MPRPLTRAFFDRPHLEVARDLVGCLLASGPCSGIIVETEAYAVEGDPACHTASRASSRRFVAARKPGDAYVYLNYGMYWLLNVLAGDGIILLRALEPLDGITIMSRRRKRERVTDLCSGPGKLGVALAIGPHHHGMPLAGSKAGEVAILPGPTHREAPRIVTDVRVGISQAADFPWRFLAAGNPHVSVPQGRVRPHAPRTRPPAGRSRPPAK